MKNRLYDLLARITPPILIPVIILVMLACHAAGWLFRYVARRLKLHGE